jgi:hypothetical protein
MRNGFFVEKTGFGGKSKRFAKQGPFFKQILNFARLVREKMQFYSANGHENERKKTCL